MSANTRLVAYGTLAPGEVNHHQLADLSGSWCRAKVRGRLIPAGWGAAHGCPGIVLDSEAPEVSVHLFESADLPAHWARLDAFEGTGYTRVVTRVRTKSGLLDASIYAVNA